MAEIAEFLHYTIPLLRVFLIDAPFTCCYLGRGAGKTSRGSSLKIKRNVEALPGSQGALLCHSYTYFYDTILPILETAWKMFGWHQDVHYWVGKKPPKELGLPESFTEIDDKKAKYFIFFYNGTVAKICSMDAQALFNGNSFDWCLLFEARKLDGVKAIQDFFPTIRGNAEQPVIGEDGKPTGKLFSDMPEHGSKWLESDLPRQPKEKWILEYMKKVDKKLIDGILIIQKRKYELLEEHKTATKKRQKEIDQDVKDIEETLAYLRGNKNTDGLVYVEIADTLSNIHGLGIRGIMDLKNSITNERDWLISILSKILIEVEDCFYANLNEDVHGRRIDYDLNTLDKLTKLSQNRDSRWDIDIRPDEQLEVAPDNNFAVNFLAVSVRRPKERYLANIFYNVSSETRPKDISHTVRDMCHYFRFHKNKKVKFIYNHTFTQGKKWGQKSIAMKITETFIECGWEVEEVYLGQAMRHIELYDNYVNLFNGEMKWKFYYSITNCEVWYTAAKQTQIKVKGGTSQRDYKKEKHSERLKSIPVIEAPHVTEAVDQFIHHDIKIPYTSSRTFATVQG